MLTPLAQRLFPDSPDGRKARDEFFQDAKNLFASEHGRRVLRSLCAVANPMEPRLGANALDMAADDGRKEVVALLLQAGSTTPSEFGFFL